MCDSYFTFVFSPSPVRDLMNSKLRALWMHFDWLSSQILSFSYPESSFIMLVFKIIYFSLVLGEVTQAFTLAFLMNS